MKKKGGKGKKESSDEIKREKELILFFSVFQMWSKEILFQQHKVKINSKRVHNSSTMKISIYL